MKKTICLNMIVKNESHIIEELLEGIYKYVDYYVINDTGSTDDTREKIKKFFDSKEIKGEIIDHEFRSCKCHENDDTGRSYKRFDWFHFGWNRTFALEQCYGKSDYILIMDADDVIVGDLNLDNLTHDSYNLKIGTGFVYYRPLIFKNDKNLKWKWYGGIHEFLGSGVDIKRANLEGDYHVESRRLGARSLDPNKYLKDANIFLDLLKEEPNNERYMFYCAQSFKDCGKLEESIYWYSKRVEKGGWVEEVFYSLLQIGICMKNLKKDTSEVISAFEKCYNYYPRRVEPIYEIFSLCQPINDFKTSFKYISKALNTPFPEDNVLFIYKDIYDYKMEFEVALCYFYNGYIREAYDLWNKILKSGKCNDQHYIKVINSNIGYCIPHLKNNKKTVVFYVGYTPDIVSSPNNYGSELALKSLAEHLTKTYDVYVFGTGQSNNIKNGVYYNNSSFFSTFQKNNVIDILVISRYIHFFLEFKNTALKTYIWFHDNLAHPYWHGLAFPQDGKFLIENMEDKINGIVTLSDWHKGNIVKHYDYNQHKVSVIGNAINTSLFDKKIDKVKNRFIYTSSPVWGLDKLVNYFHKIREKFNDAELYIYRDVSLFSKELLEEIAKYEYIKLMGKYENAKIIEEFLKADVWFYPTNISETYCISALEAQMAGCLCIASNLGALSTTIGDRGIILKSPIYTKEYEQECYDNIFHLLSDEGKEKKLELQEKGIKWAKEQNWDNRTEEWLKLFNK